MFMEKRTLLCLHRGRFPGLAEQIDRIAVGWSVLHSDTLEALATLAQRHSPSIGLLALGESGTDQHVAELEHFLLGERRMEWIGLVHPHRLTDPVVREFIAKFCHDYHSLPLDDRRLFDSIGHAHGMATIRRYNVSDESKPINGYQMIGCGPAMAQVFREIDKIANADASVMIGGASGTGKELAALAIHRHSQRAEKPFVAVNCGAIPGSLIQSELFGHEKGAFTGAHRRQIGRIEAADGGTVFLDEIGDLSLDLQVTLLRFLQERVIERVGSSEPVPVDVRVIAATHKDMQKSVQSGQFREDLYYRLHVLSLELPPLRERSEDIEPLAQHYLRVFSKECRRRVDGFSTRALQSLNAHDWPGNVRELKNRVHRAVVMAERRLITPEDLHLEEAAGNGQSQVVSLAQARSEAERRAMQQALELSGNNISEAARKLGISRVSFYRKMEKLNLSSP